MKKLNLKNLKLDDNHMLQRDQLKTVFGGLSQAPAECIADCWCGESVACDGLMCTAADDIGCTGYDDDGRLMGKSCDDACNPIIT